MDAAGDRRGSGARGSRASWSRQGIQISPRGPVQEPGGHSRDCICRWFQRAVHHRGDRENFGAVKQNEIELGRVRMPRLLAKQKARGRVPEYSWRPTWPQQ
jgi:hypothetical protein